MFYSRSKRGFYSLELHGDKIPEDAVEVSCEEYAALLDGQSAGLVIVPDQYGRPTLQDPPPLTADQLAVLRRAEILYSLERIDTASSRPLRAILVGSATDEDRARLAELDEQAAALRLELSALDASAA